MVAIPPDRCPDTVRSFPSFTQDLQALADWLSAHQIWTVALESTGVYWIPVFEILEARGFEVILTNARDARNVPGRKSEVNDAQWLQKLHEFGLLRAGFQPNQEVAVLRTYLRQRERLLDYCSAYIQHMQKTLMQMNVQHCDQRIEAALASLEVPEQVLQALLPKARHKTKVPNAPAFDVRDALYRALRLDLTQIHGLGPYVSLKLVAECGTDMTRWLNAKHFTSWLCLSPGTKISGGRMLASRTRRSSSRAEAILRLAATTLARTDTALGVFYRRLSSLVGKAKAVTGTARKVVTLFYNAMRYGMNYVDPGADYYERRYRERVVYNLRRRAQSLDLEVREPTPAPEGVS